MFGNMSLGVVRHMAPDTEGSGSGGEGPDVTFVGGRAVEQREAMSSDLAHDEREAAKAAVRKAMQEAENVGKETAEEDDLEERVKDPTGTKRFAKAQKEAEEAEEDDADRKTPKTAKEVATRDSSGKFLPKDGAKTKETQAEKDSGKEKEDLEEELDVTKSSVKQLLKNREKLAALKKEQSAVRGEADKARQEVEAQTRQIQDVWQNLRQREAELKAQEQHLQRLRSDPASAIKNLGYDPEEFILNLAREGTPEGKAAREKAALEARVRDQENRWRAQEQAQKNWQQQQAQMMRQQARQQAVSEFVGHAFTDGKYPHIAALYSDDHQSLIAQGDLAAFEFRKLSGGREGSYPDILDYLEDKLATKLNSWYVTKSGQKVSPTESPNRQKGRSLGPDDVGERKVGSPKAMKDLSAEDRLLAAKQAVKVAMAGAAAKSKSR